MPGVVEEHDIVAEPELVTTAGFGGVQVNPVGGASVRLIVPVNPFSAVIVMVDRASVPAVTDVGDVAEILKSFTKYATVREWIREPLVPITVTL